MGRFDHALAVAKRKRATADADFAQLIEDMRQMDRDIAALETANEAADAQTEADPLLDKYKD